MTFKLLNSTCKFYLEWFSWRRPCTPRRTRRRSDNRTRSLRTPDTSVWARDSVTGCSRRWGWRDCRQSWRWSWRESPGSDDSGRRDCSRCCPRCCRDWTASRCWMTGSEGCLSPAHPRGTEDHRWMTHPEDWKNILTDFTYKKSHSYEQWSIIS